MTQSDDPIRRFNDGRPMFDLTRPAIVGILNLTPDSFSDGGRYADVAAALDHAHRMVAEGADAIDVGGESTRPGAGRVEPAEQIRRVVPVLEALAAEVDVPISIDTTSATVAEAALEAGASILNDVSAGLEDGRMFGLAAERATPIILMHKQGDPATMQAAPTYQDVVAEVGRFLTARRDAAVAAGISPERIVLDPGIGFGKTTQHNLALLGGLSDLVALGQPVMLGTSRKRFIGEICSLEDPVDRVAGTVATTAMGVAAGVQLFRVHDVGPNRQAADVTFAALGHQNP